MKRISNLLRTIPEIFLVDGIGALLTAGLLFVLVIPYHELFGLPAHVLKPMAYAGILFATYSILCYFLNPTKWPIFLKIIAGANTLYCVYTLLRLIEYRASVTIWGWIYFIGEIIIVMSLVQWEWRLSTSGPQAA